MQTINALDQKLFLTLNKWNHPVMDHFFSCITNTFFWVPLYVFLFFLIYKYLGWRGFILFIATIVIADQASASLFKPLFARYRPCYGEEMLPIHLVGYHEGIYGFPSSHASNTYAFAMLFWKIFQNRYKDSYLFFIWATIVSYGRIYGGMHYPLDIIAGAILGSAIGILTYKLAKWGK